MDVLPRASTSESFDLDAAPFLYLAIVLCAQQREELCPEQRPINPMVKAASPVFWLVHCRDQSPEDRDDPRLSMIATTMRGACLVGVFLVTIGCLAETRAYVSFDQVNPSNSSVSDDDPPKSAVPDQEAKAETDKPKLTRVPLGPRKSRRAIDGSLATINENDDRKPGRVTERPDPEDVAPTARPGAKRNHKKMKLAQTQGRKKSKKTKRYIDTATGQQLVLNPERSVLASNQKNEKYYEQRKAIIDRFHARSREIARKYRQRPYSTTEGPFRYSLGFGTATTENHRPNATPPPRVLARTNPSTPTTLIYFDEKKSFHNKSDSGVSKNKVKPEIDVEVETINVGQATTLKPNTIILSARSVDNIEKAGKCDTLQSLHMLYQNNLVLNIYKGIAVEATIFPPTEEESCVVCIIAEQTSGESQKIEINLIEKTANVRIYGSENGKISITLRFYTNQGNSDRCSALR